jgi:hypothetical protein
MWSAEVWKRPDSVEGVSEDSSLVKNSGIPQAVGIARITRGRAVTARAKGPAHCIACVDRHGGRREKESPIANCHCDRGRACYCRSENQDRSDNECQGRGA